MGATAYEFDEAVGLDPLGGGGYAARLDAGWSIGGAINGGLLMALGARALGLALAAAGGGDAAHDAPIALSAYFLSASTDGPATVTTEPVRVGRTLSTGQASIAQTVAGRQVERMRALGSFGDLRSRSEPVLRSRPAPVMPPPERCVTGSDAPESFRTGVPILARLDLRLDPSTAGWAVGRPSREGRMRGWVRFADGRPVDALSLLFFLDAMPPVAFDLGLMGWAPTLEFSGHVRAVPVDGWLLVELSTETVSGGLLEEDAAIWDESGRLVAQSRQLAGVRLTEAAS